MDGLGQRLCDGGHRLDDFPTTKNAFQTKFGGPKHTSDAFVTKITAN